MWFSTGGPDCDWNYKKFIRHFDENFEDKMAARTAGEKLTRIRQGQHQLFSAFFNDFQYLLARAKGMKWDDRAKINSLSTGLNESLSDCLVSVPLSEDNYMLFVNQVRAVANKLENREKYFPRQGPVYTETWYVSRLDVRN